MDNAPTVNTLVTVRGLAGKFMVFSIQAESKTATLRIAPSLGKPSSLLERNILWVDVFNVENRDAIHIRC
jgi:hypothetical protein